ncbi:hypothetical protein GCM10023321_47000 [Pseudonocardia eucalypti]|uniref:Uncharacterized protein n=1 Tax=Pseudonocardia eucalypti TaxID=648755 RepID=A0ABP9QHV7_9PSEU
MTIVDKVPADVRDRTSFIRYLRPGNPDALWRFRREVRSAAGFPTGASGNIS